MLRIRLLGGLILALPLSAALAAQNLPLQLREQVNVQWPQVKLADVLQWQGTDPAPPWFEQKLGQAPRVGNLAQWSRAEIAYFLHAHYLQGSDRINWSGAQQVRVQTRMQSISGSQLQQQAQELLQQKLALSAQEWAQLQVDFKQLPDVELPQGEIQLSLREPDGAAWLALQQAAQKESRVSLGLQVTVNQMFYRSLILQMNVKGEIAAAREWASRRVQRGALLAMQLVQGSLQVQTQVQALEDGAVGDVIKVRAPHSREVLLARVKSAQLLELE